MNGMNYEEQCQAMSIALYNFYRETRDEEYFNRNSVINNTVRKKCDESAKKFIDSIKDLKCSEKESHKGAIHGFRY